MIGRKLNRNAYVLIVTVAGVHGHAGALARVTRRIGRAGGGVFNRPHVGLDLKYVNLSAFDANKKAQRVAGLRDVLSVNLQYNGNRGVPQSAI